MLYIAFMLATNSHMQLHVLLMHKYDLIILVHIIYLNESKFQYIYIHTHTFTTIENMNKFKMMKLKNSQFLCVCAYIVTAIFA